MKKSRFVRMLKKGVSIVLATSLAVCAPIDVSSILGQKVRSLFKEAAAHNESTIDENKLMDSNIIPDTNLLNYLYTVYKSLDSSYTGTGYDVTVQKFNQVVKGELTIPSSVQNLQGIGYARYVTRVDLSETSVTRIDAYEFNNCKNLTQVVLPEGVKTIGDNAFQDCTRLESIDLSNVDNIGSSAFVGCSMLTDTSIGTMKASLKDLGTAAFKGCTSITKAFVPVIENSARAHSVPAELFSNCTELEKVTFFDNKLTTIAASAFVQTSALTFNIGTVSGKVIPTEYTDKLPKTITSIEESAFMGSSVLSLDLSETKITEIKKYTFRGTITGLLALFYGIKLPDTLKKIDDSAFMYTALRSITIPDSVTELEERCFYGCSLLTDITLSPNIKEIPEFSFAKYDTMNITIEDGALEYYIRNDTIVKVHGGNENSKLEKIGPYAFFAGGVNSIEFPANLTNLKEIGEYAFCYSRFTKLEIPASVETIGESAFMAIHTLKTVSFKDGSQLKEIPDNCFGSKDKVSGTYGEEPYRFFYSCYALETVTLPESVESIGEYAFGYDYKLATMGYKGKIETGKVYFPDTLKSIGKGIFRGDRSLRTVYIGNNVTEIPDEAFYESVGDNETTDDQYYPERAEGLEVVYLPKNIKKIGKQAFYSCCALKGFLDNNGNIDGQFPEALTEIGQSAFEKCKNFSSATFNSKLVSIGQSAFADCARYSYDNRNHELYKYQQVSGLSDVDFSFASSLETIGSRAFYNTNITNIDFPKNVTVIPSSVCEGCFNLKNVSMNNGVTKVEANAFKDTYMLSNVTLPITADWANTLFAGRAGNKTFNITINTTYDQASYDTEKKAEKISVNHDQDTVLDINCFKNFSVSNKKMFITERNKDASDDSNDLLKYDNNEFIRTTENGNNQISVHGKKLGETEIRLSGIIDLYPNETNKYNENQVVLSFVHDYTVSVVQNPIKKIDFESSKLVANDDKSTLYLEKGSSSKVLLTGKYYPVDTTDTVNWSIVDDTIATVSDVTTTEYTKMTQAEIDKGYGVTKGYLTAGEYGSTTLNVQASDLVFPVTVDVRYGANSVTISETSAKMDLGAKKTIKATLDYGLQFNNKKSEILAHPDLLVFESTDENVVKIDKIEATDIGSDGKVVYTLTVSTVGEGNAIVRAKSPVTERSAQCQISTEEGYVAEAKTIKFTESNPVAYVGELKELALDIIPYEATPVITYKSSDESVATVSASGTLTGHKKGTARITATTDNGLTAICNVEVNVRGTSISLDKSEVNVVVDRTTNVKATVLPEDASQKVTWESSDTSIATVSDSGVVKGIKLGTATITATSTEGFSASAKVTVYEATDTFTLSATTRKIKKGATYTLKGMVTPQGACPNFEWSSSNETIATVSNTGVVKAVRAGTARITARTPDGKTSSCDITVVSPATGLKIKAHNGNTKIAYIKRGQTLTLDKYYTNDDCTETFKFSAPKKSKVGSITESGYFTSRRAGTIKITLQSYQDGKKSKKAKFTIKVLKRAKKCKKVKITGKKTVKVGKTICLNAVTTPKNATVDVTWTSNRPAIAQIDSYGRLKGVKAGTARITVRTTNKKKKVIKVKVKK